MLVDVDDIFRKCQQYDQEQGDLDHRLDPRIHLKDSLSFGGRAVFSIYVCISIAVLTKKKNRLTSQ